MSRSFASLVFIAVLSAIGLAATAAAQAPVAGLEPNVDLGATLVPFASDNNANPFSDQHPYTNIQLGRSPATQAAAAKPSAVQDQKLFADTEKSEGGWKGLARLLEALTPSADTEIPLTASQITDRITAMLNRGENEEALRVIEKRTAQEQAAFTLGTDVQLLFLHGRALAALGRHNEAIDIYLNMTTLYPELPEPWNNLAAEYIKQDRLEMARDALHMALTANPQYATAQANMGQVQLMLAQQSFDQAAALGASGAAAKAEQTKAIFAE